MTFEELSRHRRRLIGVVLPWVVAAAGLALYLATLNHWLSFGSLGVVALTSGWDWLPTLQQPVLFVVTLPLRLLPDAVIPITLNVLTAMLSAAVLWTLARTVAILPRDRLTSFRPFGVPESSWELPLAWLPPVLAVAGLGLQLTFWEHATVGTGEMLDLFLFAFVVRCLMEYRHSQRRKWQDLALLVGGAAATNSYAALGCLPIVIIALWWMQGIEFLEGRNLLRVALLLLAGLSLYLLQPLIVAVTPEAPLSAWQAFKHNIGSQLGMLRYLVTTFWTVARDLAVLLALVSLLPILFMSIRWRSFSGGSIHLGAALVTLPFHFAHLAILTICLWVFLDPPISPRVVGRQLGYMPLLTIYYLAAVSVGYYIGYFLQFFGEYPPDDWAIGAEGRRRVARIVRYGSIFMLIAMPALLVLKNLPQIQLQNSDLTLRYAREVASALPPDGGLILSDDLLRLALTQAALAREGRLEKFIPINTAALSSPDYLKALRRLYPNHMPAAPESVPDREYESVTVLQYLADAARSNSLHYLHPSFGYFFESFYLEPRGPVYAMLRYPTNVVFQPLIATNILAANQAYWEKLKPAFLDPLSDRLAGAESAGQTPLWRVLKNLRCRPEADNNAYVLAAWQSRNLTALGVDLQRAGQIADASRWLHEAVRLKEDNLSASADLVANTNLLARQPTLVDRARPAEATFGHYRSWEEVINSNGPFDNPNYNFPLGMIFAMNGLYRQAANEFHRTAQIDPDFTPAYLMLASIHSLWGRQDEALAYIARARASRGFASLLPNEKTELSLIEASAQLGLKKLAAAEQIVAGILAARSDDPGVLDRVFTLYSSAGEHTNALRILERQQKLQPENATYLIGEGYTWMQLGLHSNAIAPLTRALELQTNSTYALFNRAAAYLGSGRPAEARRDYEALAEQVPKSAQVQCGLAEVALQQHDTNAAIQHYTRALSNFVPSSVETKFIQTRLKQLQPAPGK